ncbi:MAG: DUF2156 domain-containing protein, partial [Muribaculaceae bacterium]|nr:DUF2156 domain-containing protein [Muribaculaceae bacterium]
TPEDMPVIWEYLKLEKGRTTDFSYGGVLMWIDYFKYEYAIENDTLYIKGVVENDLSKPAFSFPIGTLPFSETIKPLRRYCEENNLTLEFSAVPEYAIPEMEKLNPVSIEELSDWGDYIYESERLAGLAGKKMEKKRNHVHQFESHYPEFKFLPLTSENADDALAFMDIFENEGDKNPIAAEERLLSRFLISRIKSGDKELKGGILYVGKEVAAYTIGDIKNDTLFIHVEKALRKFLGSYEMINWLFAKEMCNKNPNIRFINREDDSGDPGLRFAKESYHPAEILKKYNVIFS